MKRVADRRGRWLFLLAGVVLTALVSSCTGGSISSQPCSPVSGGAGITIALRNNQDPIPKYCHPRPAYHEKFIRWKNDTNTERTLTFQKWPFSGDQVVITVPANGYTCWYTVSPTIGARQYNYHVDPPLQAKRKGPPDEPDVHGGE